ncbi:hypothetical protein [Halobaculum litoreum]|uniref:Uncharacterized protein n=1 Tax=Halobaculum litoreum TaxID=3031998 RepID=A0ABD5XUY9_9EURY|nr:hypothetical protein [Halobaculum sp. DT92]
MSLRHAGATLFGAGLLVWAVAYVVLGPVAASTEAACLDPVALADYAITGVQSWPPTLTYTDGCNRKTLQPLVLWPFLASVAGLGLAGVGQVLAERS